MEERKRRSSILKKVYDVEAVDEGTVKPKRRISFSGKKSIRIFSGEEEPHAWNNSYEESDSATNICEDADKKIVANIKFGQKINLPISTTSKKKSKVKQQQGQKTDNEINKENFNVSFQCEDNNRSRISEKKDKVNINATPTAQSIKSQYIKNCYASTLSTTMDFINNTDHNNSLYIENSVDVSLHAREYVHPIASFSVQECEREALFNRRKVNSKFSRTNQPLNLTGCSSNTEYKLEDNCNKNIFMENMKEISLENNNQPTTLEYQAFNVGETIAEIMLKENVKNLKRKTTHKNMETSFSSITKTPLIENNIQTNNSSKVFSEADISQGFRSLASEYHNSDENNYCYIENESVAPSDKSIKISFHEILNKYKEIRKHVDFLRQPDNKNDYTMDMSIENDYLQVFKRYPSNSKNNTIDFENCMEQTCQNMNLSCISSNCTNECKNKNNKRKPIIFDKNLTEFEISKLNESPVNKVPWDTSILDNLQLQKNNIESDLIHNNISTETNFNKNNSNELLLWSKPSYPQANKSRKCRRTIIFNDQISKLDLKKSNTQQIIKDVTPKIEKHASETYSFPDLKRCSGYLKGSPNKFVTENNKSITNDSLKSIFVNNTNMCKKKDMCMAFNKNPNFTKLGRGISFNIQNTLLSHTDISSSMVCDEFIIENKRLNFRQLTNGIEKGHLCFFPQNQINCNNIQRIGLNRVENKSSQDKLIEICVIRQEQLTKLLGNQQLINKSRSQDEKNVKEANTSEDTKCFTHIISNKEAKQHSHHLDINEREESFIYDKNINLETAEIFTYMNLSFQQKPIYNNEYKQKYLSNLDNEFYLHRSPQTKSVSNKLYSKLCSNSNVKCHEGTYCCTEVHVENSEMITNDTDVALDIFLTRELCKNSKNQQHFHKACRGTEIYNSEIERKKFMLTLPSISYASVPIQNFGKSETNESIDINIEKIMIDNEFTSNHSPLTTVMHNEISQNSLQMNELEELTDITESQFNFLYNYEKLKLVPETNPEFNSKEKYNQLKRCLGNNNSSKLEITLTSKLVKDSNTSVNAKHKTMLFKYGEDMDLDDVKLDDLKQANLSMRPVKRQTLFALPGIYNSSNSNMQLNKADFVNNNLCKQYSKVTSHQLPNELDELEDSLHIKLKKIREIIKKPKYTILKSNVKISHYESPRMNHRKQVEAFHRLCEGTPHRSVIEFEDLEKEIESNIKDNQINKHQFKTKPKKISSKQHDHLKQKYNLSTHSKVESNFNGFVDEANLIHESEAENSNAKKNPFYSSQLTSNLVTESIKYVDVKLDSLLFQDGEDMDLDDVKLNNLEKIFSKNGPAKRHNVIYKGEANLIHESEEEHSNVQIIPIFNSQDNAQDIKFKNNLIRNRKSIYNNCNIVSYKSELKLLGIDDEKDEVRLKSHMEKEDEVERSRKRTTINLTPIHTIAKKRNTQHFTDYCMDESSKNKQQMQVFVRNDFIVIDDSCGDQLDPEVLDLEDGFDNYEYECLQINSPDCLQISRNPIHIDSANKFNATRTRFLSPYAHNETNINCSLQTIGIPRLTTKFDNNKDSFISIISSHEFPKSHGTEELLNDTKFKANFDDDPITISDVSVFYLSQREKSTAKQTSVCNNVLNYYRESSEDNTVNNIAKFKKRYMDLSCSSPLVGFDLDDIEKTRLSLVETLLDDDNEDGVKRVAENLVAKEEKPKSGQSIFNKNNVGTKALAPAPIVQTLKDVSVVCRTCKRCQNSIMNETSANGSDSLALPVMPSNFDLGVDRLKTLRSKPGFSEVNEYWRHINFYNAFTKEDFCVHYKYERNGEAKYADKIIKAHKDSIQITQIQVTARYSKQIKVLETTPLRLLKMKLSSNPNWIFDSQMEWRGLLQFDHRKILTISVIILYKHMNTFGHDVEISNIQMQPSSVPQKNWKPYSYVLDFQLKLEVPSDLGALSSKSDWESIFEVLNEMDKICVSVEKLGRCFWRLLCKMGGSIIREVNSIYVRKIVRLVTDSFGEKSLEEIEFKIEITNLRKICYKDIVAPPLHIFLEDIQYLPMGLEFLSLFLKNPTSFLKKN